MRNNGLEDTTSDEKALLLYMIFFTGVFLLLMVTTSGCISYSKSLYAEAIATPSTPTPTPELTPEPTPTPEPAPTLSEAQQMAMTNGLHMGQLLTVKRDNVSGYKDMSFHASVWGWRMFGVVSQSAAGSWGTDRYFRIGAGEGHKFLFVFVNTTSDEGMSRMWGIQPHQWVVQIGDQLYYPTDKLEPEYRLKQFDEIWDSRHVENLKPYGYLRAYDDKGYQIAVPLGYLKAGNSNPWDGYIPYIIPANTTPQEIKVIGNFHDLAESHWWTLE